MSKNFEEMKKTCDEEDSPGIMARSLFSLGNSMVVQILFWSQDQNQSVEAVETGEIDFGEIIQRLQNGESIFIKNKNPETYEPHQNILKKKMLARIIND